MRGPICARDPQKGHRHEIAEIPIMDPLGYRANSTIRGGAHFSTRFADSGRLSRANSARARGDLGYRSRRFCVDAARILHSWGSVGDVDAGRLFHPGSAGDGLPVCLGDGHAVGDDPWRGNGCQVKYWAWPRLPRAPQSTPWRGQWSRQPMTRVRAAEVPGRAADYGGTNARQKRSRSHFQRPQTSRPRRAKG